MSLKCKCGDGEGVLVLRFSSKLRLSREEVSEKSAHGKDAWFKAYKVPTGTCSILFGNVRENRLYGRTVYMGRGFSGLFLGVSWNLGGPLRPHS